MNKCSGEVGRVTPGAPLAANSFSNGAQGVTRPTSTDLTIYQNFFIAALVLWVCIGGAQEAEIVVHADPSGHQVSRYLTGACIEDVNHEIYGGLYSQMIFGESFQEQELTQIGRASC